MQTYSFFVEIESEEEVTPRALNNAIRLDKPWNSSRVTRAAELPHGADSNIQKACPEKYHEMLRKINTSLFCSDCGEQLFS